jgi:hypothetical protein
MQARDQSAPVILYKFSTPSYPLSDCFDDFVLKSGQCFAGREE